MNGFSSRGQNDFESAAPPPLRPRLTPRLSPRGPALVESYRQDSLNDFEKDPPRFNPVSSYLSFLIRNSPMESTYNLLDESGTRPKLGASRFKRSCSGTLTYRNRLTRQQGI
ncbi:hypothetical protein F5Y02DRAFT_371277 [Annulohypoxylon stygium]|nr:hypothetical protein F5Y02DRAFT_371277 [Annulohypoxylon stygium]